ncbi:MAG TPA: RDD family protein [Niastella sp.]
MNIFNGNPRLQELAMHTLDRGIFRRHDIESALAPFIFLQKGNDISIRVLMTDDNPVDFAKRMLAKEEFSYDQFAICFEGTLRNEDSSNTRVDAILVQAYDITQDKGVILAQAFNPKEKGGFRKIDKMIFLGHTDLIVDKRIHANADYSVEEPAVTGFSLKDDADGTFKFVTAVVHEKPSVVANEIKFYLREKFSGEQKKNISGQFDLTILQVPDNDVDFLTFLVSNAINEELASDSVKSWKQETRRTVYIIVKRDDDIIYETETPGYEQCTDKQLYDEFNRIAAIPDARTNIKALTKMSALLKEFKFRGLEVPAAGAQFLTAYHKIRPEEMIRAKPGKRILNFIIDFIASFLAATFLYGITVDFILPPKPISYTPRNSNSDLLDLLYFFSVYALFMGIMEAGYKGKTIGKFLTKTKAVNLDGSPISIKTAFARAFIRAIPLNPLSALTSACNPWHDKWTNTTVIIDEL